MHWTDQHCKICECFWLQEEARIVFDLMRVATLREVYGALTYVQEQARFRSRQNWKIRREAAENVQ